MAFQLVENWRSARKWISLNCMTLAGAVQGAWVYIPADMKSTVPPNLVGGVTIALLVLGVLGRFIQQSPSAAPVTEDAP